MYAASVRADIPKRVPAGTGAAFREVACNGCPFTNLPERTEGRWGEGLTAAKMAACCSLEAIIVLVSSSWNGRPRIDYATRAALASAATRTQVKYFENERLVATHRMSQA
jgi:hypothetical protein